MNNLQRITKNKEVIAKEKTRKALAREARKRQRAHEKELEKEKKEKRAKERDMARKEVHLRRSKIKHLEHLMQKVTRETKKFRHMMWWRNMERICKH